MGVGLSNRFSHEGVSRMKRRGVVAGVAVIFCLVLVLGCGGGGQQSATDTGGMEISVTFPPLQEGVQPAVIYGATNSISIDLLDPDTGNSVVPRTVINRPDAGGGEVTVSIEDIPAGEWLMLILGWDAEDASGKLVSDAKDMITINTGDTTEKSIVMEGWPYSLVVTASPNPILVDGTAQIVVTPKDVEGNTLLRDFIYKFESSNTGVCTVVGAGSSTTTSSISTAATSDPHATATGVARGQATITATLEAEASTSSANVDTAQDPVTGSVDITVNPNVDEVVVDPATCTVNIGETVQITAEARYQGNVVSDIDFSFSSADSSVASVSKTGQNTADITGESGGQIDVTAAQPYTSASDTCQVTVPYGNANVAISGSD